MTAFTIAILNLTMDPNYDTQRKADQLEAAIKLSLATAAAEEETNDEIRRLMAMTALVKHVNPRDSEEYKFDDDPNQNVSMSSLLEYPQIKSSNAAAAQKSPPLEQKEAAFNEAYRNARDLAISTHAERVKRVENDYHAALSKAALNHISVLNLLDKVLNLQTELILARGLTETLTHINDKYHFYALEVNKAKVIYDTAIKAADSVLNNDKSQLDQILTIEKDICCLKKEIGHLSLRKK